MKRCGKLKHAILIELVLILLLLAVRQAGGTSASVNSDSVLMEENAEEETGKDYIKWVDFNVSCEALSQAYETDVDTYRRIITLTGFPCWPILRPGTAASLENRH